MKFSEMKVVEDEREEDEGRDEDEREDEGEEGSFFWSNMIVYLYSSPSSVIYTKLMSTS